jgi:4-hydroxy-3-polyprenylbenzoate decarboxylase
MHAIWGLGLLSLTKCVIVVDADIDVHDYAQVTWQVGANVDPGRDILLSSGPLDQLDHAPSIQSLGGKIGIDATAKWSSEGYPREWPEVARMSVEVQTRVSERWAELGIPLTGTPRTTGAGARTRRRGRLRRTR